MDVRSVRKRIGLALERPVADTRLASGDAGRITDAEGRWSLENVPPGETTRVALKISHPDYINSQSGRCL